MDAVAAAASITQLAVYSECAAKYLLRLYSTARDALSLVQCQQEDILVLLQVIHRLINDNGSLDSELLLPVFIRVIEIARTLSNWFDESGFLGIKWTLVKRRAQIDDALHTLKRKGDLLRLYLVERNHAVLLRVETSRNKESKDMAGFIEKIGANLSRKRLRKKSKVMKAARTSAGQSSVGQSSAGQSSAGQSLVRLNSGDEGTREVATAADPQLQPYGDQQPYHDQQQCGDQQPHLYQQPQTLQSQYQQCSSATQSNDQQAQERQKTKWKLKMCGNDLTESNISLANGWRDLESDFDIDCSENVGKKSTFNAFNWNDGEERREEDQSEVL